MGPVSPWRVLYHVGSKPTCAQPPATFAALAQRLATYLREAFLHFEAQTRPIYTNPGTSI